MKIDREWWRGLFDGPMFCIYGVVLVGDVIFILSGLWPLVLSTAVIPILAIDHVIWNVSRNEAKYDYTGPLAGFRLLFK